MTPQASKNNAGLTEIPDELARDLLSRWPGDQLLAANLTALESRDQQLAQNLRSVEIPDSVEMAVTLDGTASFRFRQNDGRRTWLGFTSTPIITAQASADRVEVSNVNMAVNGIGSGREIKALLNKMSPFQALIVAENDPLKLLLVLKLIDFQPELKSGKLVLLLGDQKPSLIENFCDTNPGYNLPTQAGTWPWLSDKENQTFARQISDAMSRSTPKVIRKINELLIEQQKLDRQFDVSKLISKLNQPTQLCCTNCTGTLSPLDRCTSRDALAGLAQLGCRTEHLVLNRPDQVSHYGQLARLQKLQPDLVVLVDLLRSDLNHSLPQSTVCVTLLRQGITQSSNNKSLTDRIGPHDFVCPAFDYQTDYFLQNNLSPDRLIKLPPAVNTEIFQPLVPASVDKPLEPTSADPSSHQSDVVLVADHCTTDPHEYRIKHDTHKQLWYAIADEIRRSVGKYQPESAPKFLAQAQRCGVTLQEDDIRNYFIELIRNFLGDAVVYDTYCSKLLKENLDLKIFSWAPTSQTQSKAPSPGWAESPLNQLVAGTVANGPDLNTLYNSGKIFLHLTSRGCPDSYLLDGIAAGAFFLVRSHPHDTRKDGLGEMFELGRELITFDSANDLAGKVRYYLKHQHERNSIAQAARKKLLQHHTSKIRMAHLLKELQKKLSTPS
ncbi:MAG: glycosyltransferase family 1 protein [Sedimentisphaerales bacterium]|nr:glycosyltransferase family 1 protein [Sedimentisphaerales bacterium]